MIPHVTPFPPCAPSLPLPPCPPHPPTPTSMSSSHVQFCVVKPPGMWAFFLDSPPPPPLPTHPMSYDYFPFLSRFYYSFLVFPLPSRPCLLQGRTLLCVCAVCPRWEDVFCGCAPDLADLARPVVDCSTPCSHHRYTSFFVACSNCHGAHVAASLCAGNPINRNCGIS